MPLSNDGISHILGWQPFTAEQLNHFTSDSYHHNRFTALFPGPPGWAGARRELLDFMVQGEINRGGHADHPAGRHSIRTNQLEWRPARWSVCLPLLISPCTSLRCNCKWCMNLKPSSSTTQQQHDNSRQAATLLVPRIQYDMNMQVNWKADRVPA